MQHLDANRCDSRMNEALHTPRAAWDEEGPGRDHALRELGARAHQLRAATRAADHFTARGDERDTHTGAWLMSSALALSQDLAEDIDALARSFRDRPDPGLQPTVAALRVRAHQLHAATRAADHYLEQDTPDDRDTGGWLIATALGLATKLASEIDDSVNAARRPTVTTSHESIEPHDAQVARRIAAAMPPARGF
jgi:hypothetical protein